MSDRNRVRFLILAHVDGDQIAFAAVERVGQRQRGFGFADAARADQQKDADGAARIGQVGARRADALARWLRARASWPITRSFEPLVQARDGLDFVGHHLADGNAGPAGDDFGDGLRVDDTACISGVSPCTVLEFFVQTGQLASQRHNRRASRRGAILRGCRCSVSAVRGRVAKLCVPDSAATASAD